MSELPAKSFIQDFMDKMKLIHENLLEFLENEDISTTDNQKIIQIFNDQKIFENNKEFKIVLYLISSISSNHYRTKGFIEKIEQIIKSIEPEIKKNFTNLTIFSIFRRSKRLLYFLFKEKIICRGKYIDILFKTFYFTRNLYPEYLLQDKNDTKKQIGENDEYICELIRNDSVDEFIQYVNTKNVSLSSHITESIYETNSFLDKKRNSLDLISYAAFFGSIQIFNYLRINGVELIPDLWLFAIHGNNPEIIMILEENKIAPDSISDSFSECYEQAVRCHHVNIAKYIRENYLSDPNNKELDKIHCCDHRFYNFIGISQFNDVVSFYSKDDECINTYLCKYDYYPLVDYLSKTRNYAIRTNWYISEKMVSRLVLDGNNDMFKFIALKNNDNATRKIISFLSFVSNNISYYILLITFLIILF